MTTERKPGDGKIREMPMWTCRDHKAHKIGTAMMCHDAEDGEIYLCSIVLPDGRVIGPPWRRPQPEAT